MTMLLDAVPLGDRIPGYHTIVAPEVVDGQVIYVARHPDLPRVYSQGLTPDEALADLAEVREAYLADLRDAGVAPPPPTDAPTVQRLELHAPELPAPTIKWRVVKGVTRHVTIDTRRNLEV
jgi:predicted RNase H-like HicB family nuclease